MTFLIIALVILFFPLLRILAWSAMSLVIRCVFFGLIIWAIFSIAG